MPPRRGNDVEVSITIGDVPDYYWQAVPTSAFLSINLSDKVIRDRNQVRTIVQQSQPETVRIENNIVINNVIQVNEIEKATNAKVPVLVEKPVSNPNAAGQTTGNSVAIFNPDVAADTNAKPQKALKVDEVVTARKAQGIQPADVPADQPAAAAPAVDKAAPAVDKNGKPIIPADQPAVKAQGTTGGKATTDTPAVVKQDPNGTVVPKPADPNAPKVDAQGNVDAQGKVDVNKPKEAAPPVPQKPAVVAPAVKAPEVKTAPATAPAVEAPGKTPKIDKPAVTPPADTGGSKTDVPAVKSNKKDAGTTEQKTLDQNATPPADAQTPPADGKKAQEPAKKDEKGKAKCDPNVETCPPAQ